MGIVTRSTGLLALAATALASGGDEPTLTGPDVVSFNHWPTIPFVSSARFVRQGTRIDGGCRYDHGVTTLAPDELPPGHSLVSVTRAHDPVACRELVEKGIVPKAGLPKFDTDGGATNRSSGTLRITGPGSGSTPIPPR